MKRGLQAVAVAIGVWLTLATCADAATLAVVQEADLCGGGVDTVDGEQLEDELVDCEN